MRLFKKSSYILIFSLFITILLYELFVCSIPMMNNWSFQININLNNNVFFKQKKMQWMSQFKVVTQNNLLCTFALKKIMFLLGKHYA